MGYGCIGLPKESGSALRVLALACGGAAPRSDYHPWGGHHRVLSFTVSPTLPTMDSPADSSIDDLAARTTILDYGDFRCVLTP